jgi:23S rRNA pseudouridine2457 synthase
MVFRVTLRYFVINKPYGMLSQFTREIPAHRVLSDLYNFPSEVYPVGRLDRDSEGLLILTNDKTLNQRLLTPHHGHRRTYWVQVEGEPTGEAVAALRSGVNIRIKQKNYRTAPAEVKGLTARPKLPERDPPIRYRKTVPDTWLSLTLTEGKNRQVRRMCAAVGFPVLRLVRFAVADLTLDDLAGATVLEYTRTDLFAKLGLSAT